MPRDPLIRGRNYSLTVPKTNPLQDFLHTCNAIIKSFYKIHTYMGSFASTLTSTDTQQFSFKCLREGAMNINIFLYFVHKEKLVGNPFERKLIESTV